MHRINPPSEDEEAYEPWEPAYPDVPLQASVAAGVYRDILETFAAHCYVSLADDFAGPIRVEEA
jgi:hypothetical protein